MVNGTRPVKAFSGPPHVPRFHKEAAGHLQRDHLIGGRVHLVAARDCLAGGRVLLTNDRGQLIAERGHLIAARECLAGGRDLLIGGRERSSGIATRLWSLP